MKDFIQMVLLIACFGLVFKLYRNQPKKELLISLITISFIGVLKVGLPWIEQEVLRYTCVLVVLMGCAWSYYLIQKQDPK